jgi:cell division protein FtsL
MEANKTIEMKSKQRAFFSSFKKILYLVLIVLAGMIAYFAVTIEDEVDNATFISVNSCLRSLHSLGV